ncbi:MAG: hypothetical protein AAF957_25665 [Planctomycetota bacterium]
MTGDAASNSERFGLVALSLVVAVVSYVTFSDFLLEDSYITLRYADNLANGRGMVFQSGEPYLGTSSPLWTLVLALAIALGGSPEIVLDVLYCASLGALAYAGGRLLQRLATPRVGLLFPLAVCLGFGRLHAYWGMETPLFLALLFGAWGLALDRRYALAGVLLGLACVARYEGYAFAIALAAVLAAQKAWPAMRAGGLAVTAVTLPWLVVAWLYYGSPIPQTLGAKAGRIPQAHYLRRSFETLGHDLFWPVGGLVQPNIVDSVKPYVIGWGLAVLVGVFGAIGIARLARERNAVALALPLGALIVFVGLVLIAPVAAFAWHRAPIHYVALVCALAGVGPLLGRMLTAPGLRIARIGAVAVLVVASVPILFASSARLRSNYQYAGREVGYVEIADFLAGTGLNECAVLTWEPGYLAFMSDVRVIDLDGLVTPAPEFTKAALTSWDSGFPPEADMVLLRAPFRPAGFELVYEGAMGSRLFARDAVAERYADSIEAYRAQDPPRDDTRPLSDGPVAISPGFVGPNFEVEPDGSSARIVSHPEPLAFTAETPMLWIDAPAMEIEFQTSSPRLVQLQLVVRGVVVLSTGNDLDPGTDRIRWDVEPWADRAARVRVLALAGANEQATLGVVQAAQ